LPLKNRAAAQPFCRNGRRPLPNLETVRVRRSRPSAPALALALMLTMLCVYLISLSGPENTQTAAAQEFSSAEVHMEGLKVAFLPENRSENQLEARVLAARCAQNGGAGLLLHWDGVYSIIREAVSPNYAGENALIRSAEGLTLKIDGPAGQIAAVSDCVAFLRALATETGSLAASLENGDTNAQSMASLLEIYRSRGRRLQEALQDAAGANPIAKRLENALVPAITRLEEAIADPVPGKIKLIHAAACAEWISMLDEFARLSSGAV